MAKFTSLTTTRLKPGLGPSLLKASLVTAITLSSAAFAEEHRGADAQYSGGITLGILGVGANLSGMTNWSLTDKDQIQWRAHISGLDADFDDGDDLDLAGIDYEDGNYSLFSLQAGLDWYPFASGWADEVFFSGGLLFVDSEFSAKADMDKSFKVGDTRVNPGDIDALQTDIESRQLMPYLSLGWGNKLDGERGFDFQAEIGVAIPTRDADVDLTARDPASFLSAADLRKEEDDIEDDIEGLAAFGTLSVSYHF